MIAVALAGRCLQHHYTGSTPGVQLTEELEQSTGNLSPSVSVVVEPFQLTRCSGESCFTSTGIRVPGF